MIPKISNHTQTPLGVLKDALVKNKIPKSFPQKLKHKRQLMCQKKIQQVEAKNKMKKKFGKKLQISSYVKINFFKTHSAKLKHKNQFVKTIHHVQFSIFFSKSK